MSPGMMSEFYLEVSVTNSASWLANLPMGSGHIFEEADRLEGEVVVVVDKVHLQNVPVHLSLFFEAGLQALLLGPPHHEDHAALAILLQ